jgi:hypothetical protein
MAPKTVSGKKGTHKKYPEILYKTNNSLRINFAAGFALERSMNK